MNKEKKCLCCGKSLIDEKLPFCLRCRLEKRNTAREFTGFAVGGIFIVGKVLIDKNKK